MDKDRLAIIGEQLAKLRKDKNLTQKDLAEKCELSRKYISQVEAGGRNPSLNVLFKIVKALDSVVEITIN